jgi:hypothetical protein
VEKGLAEADTHVLFDQFYVDIEELKKNVRTLLRNKSQVSLSEILNQYQPTKGVAEVLGYIQIATGEVKHYINREKNEVLWVENRDSGESYQMRAPLVIFNR